METCYQIKYMGFEYDIIIFKDDDKYSFEIQFPGGCYESLDVDDMIVYSSIMEAIDSAVNLICEDDKKSAIKILREIKLEELID